MTLMVKVEELEADFSVKLHKTVFVYSSLIHHRKRNIEAHIKIAEI